MTTAYEIPLSPKPQQLSISLSGQTYILRLTWCWPVQAWVLDVSDSVGNALVSGVPLVTGADLLEQFEYLGIGGQLIVQSDASVDVVPTFTSLGQRSHVFYVV
jgi:hypothetical protein